MRSLSFLRFLLFMPLLAGCGLPDTYFLAPPGQIVATQTSTNFAFVNPDHSADLDVSFQGFDLYYRFYANSSEINVNAYDNTNYNDPVSQLLNNGFLPVCSVNDTSPPTRASPVIPVATSVRVDSFTVDAFFNYPNAQNPFSDYSYTPPSTGTLVSVELRRDVADPNLGYGCKNFAPNSVRQANYGSSTDTDMSVPLFSNCVSANGGFAYLAMYVMSYGLAGGTTPTWLTPVYLGYLYVQIN